MGVASDVHQDISQGAVNNPRRHILAVFLAVDGDLAHSDFKLVELVVPCFIHTWRLACRANKHAREQIAQRRVVVPVRNQAGEHFGFAQKRAVSRRCTAQHKVVTATGAGVAAIGHELFGR